jgi:membrane-bound metal-dependent hydrolase YbcI (DUF457 family)
MATPVGPYLFGLSIAVLAAPNATERRQAPWWALIACAPDLDVLPGAAVGQLGRFHHDASHSLAAAGLVALTTLAFVTYRRGRPALWTAAVVFVLYASHSALDYVTVDTGPPIGIPLLWPWSQQTFQAPWPLLPNVQHTRAPLVSVHNALLMVRETLIFAPLVGLALAGRAPLAPGRSVAMWLWGVGFLLAAGLSVASLG